MDVLRKFPSLASASSSSETCASLVRASVSSCSRDLHAAGRGIFLLAKLSREGARDSELGALHIRDVSSQWTVSKD
eukprot:8740798-Pyramimonas_sp.AAC.2